MNSEQVPNADGSGRADVIGPQRQAFDVPEAVAYFNTANLSPLLHSVRAAGEAALRRRARPWTIQADDWFDEVEQLRSLFAAVIGADAEGVALVPATSYGFAVAARNIPLSAGQRVVVLAEEFPSGIYTWRRLAEQRGADVHTVVRQPEQTWTEAVFEALDERVGVISVPNVHWTDGALVDLEPVAARSRELGARLVLDASQSAGAMPLDVAVLRPDFVICVGYKWLLGPFGRGYLWTSTEHRQGQPLEENWILRAGSEDFARLVDYRDEYQPGARRYDQGERTLFELTPMALAAVNQILDWGVERIAATLREVTEQIATRVTRLDPRCSATEPRGPHLLGLRLPAKVLGQVLPALTQAQCFAALRGDVLRIAPHLHVTATDIDRLIETLAKTLQTAE